MQKILDTSIKELEKNITRRFSYVEMAFFAMWWQEQNETTKVLVKQLVDGGRLQFVGGGWCSNDEATTHYTAIIDQMTLGFQLLIDTFGEMAIPKVAWQVDPFGHSKEQARLFYELGMDGLFVGRVDFEEKNTRASDNTLEMIWESSPDTPLFTGITYGGYYPPRYFCFDQLCGDNNMHTMQNLTTKFYDVVKEERKSYNTNNVMVTMGGDFHYTNATKNFYYTDELIESVNNKFSDINVFYSTPNCYLYAVNQAKKTYSVKTDDFFPYKDGAHRYWTGYFTSRPTHKYCGRRANGYLQAVKQLQTLADLRDDVTMGQIYTLARAVAVLQHHDGMTGTERQHVAEDYTYRLSHGMNEADQVSVQAMKTLTGFDGINNDNVHFCRQVNISWCPFTKGRENFVVLLYNPLARSRIFHAEIPVSDACYSVHNGEGNNVTSQVNELSIISEQTASSSRILSFPIELPAMGFGVAVVSNGHNSTVEGSDQETNSESSEQFVIIENEYLRLEFDKHTGSLSKITNLEIGKSITATQELMHYTGNTHHPVPGAYIFRPESDQPESMAGNVTSDVVSGILVQEIHQHFQQWAKQIVRLRKGQRHAEFEWTVGPIPVEDNKGKDVVSRFTTNIENNGIFYTDGNGRAMEEHRRNYRKSWNIVEKESVAGNYYPVTSAAAIKDADIQLTVLTDRAQGASSVHDGQLELMVHRRHLVDDGLGVGEPLNERDNNDIGIVVRGRHYVQLENVEEAAKYSRLLAKELFAPPVVALMDYTHIPTTYPHTSKSVGDVKSVELPENVHLLTLQVWNTTTTLVRLEHIFDEGEDETLSQPAQVDLNELFTSTDVAHVSEMTLGANQKLDEVQRLVWKTEAGETESDMTVVREPVNDDLQVIIKPMQIRTFLITTN